MSMRVEVVRVEAGSRVSEKDKCAVTRPGTLVPTRFAKKRGLQNNREVLRSSAQQPQRIYTYFWLISCSTEAGLFFGVIKLSEICCWVSVSCAEVRLEISAD